MTLFCCAMAGGAASSAETVKKQQNARIARISVSPDGQRQILSDFRPIGKAARMASSRRAGGLSSPRTGGKPDMTKTCIKNADWIVAWDQAAKRHVYLT